MSWKFLLTICVSVWICLTQYFLLSTAASNGGRSSLPSDSELQEIIKKMYVENADNMDEITAIKIANQASIGCCVAHMCDTYYVLYCVQHNLIWMLLIYGMGIVYAMRNRVKHCNPWYFYIRFVHSSITILMPNQCVLFLYLLLIFIPYD